MKILNPSLVIVTGVAGTGKSTTVKLAVEQIANSFILEKDPMNEAGMHVVPTKQYKLPTFQDYVQADNVYPNNIREVETPFGHMLLVDPVNEFYGRHGRDQTFLTMAEIARTNLKLGKVPIIDCMVIRQIQDGTVQKFLDQKAFKEYSTHLIHITADEDELFDRLTSRAKVDPISVKRYEKQISSRVHYHEFVTKDQPLVPEELQRYSHHIINTSHLSRDECARELIDYISQ
jgi:RNase adaptor protein for sRNA GlmZ degradation